jgi:XTP/dITP diphosphohydrolase
MLQLLAATTNKHKIQEFQAMLDVSADSGRVCIISPDSIKDFPEIVENGTSFEENARIKAGQAASYADMAAFADDSGLEVAALGGAPGIYSARYGGENATYPEKIAKLLKELENVKDRRARFVCVIALAYRGDIVETFRGEVTGRIALESRGAQGFGYDPVFIPDGYDKTFGELGEEVKSKISHRARAFALAAEFVHRELQTMDDFEFV